MNHSPKSMQKHKEQKAQLKTLNRKRRRRKCMSTNSQTCYIEPRTAVTITTAGKQSRQFANELQRRRKKKIHEDEKKRRRIRIIRTQRKQGNFIKYIIRTFFLFVCMYSIRLQGNSLSFIAAHKQCGKRSDKGQGRRKDPLLLSIK